jgi:hypothetical protein
MQFRRLRTKLGAPIAIKAMAAKLARLVYRMLRYGMKLWTREPPSTRLNTNSYKSSSSSGKLPNWDTKSPQYPRQPKDEFLRSQRAILSLPQLYRICTELPEHTVLRCFPPLLPVLFLCAALPLEKSHLREKKQRSAVAGPPMVPHPVFRQMTEPPTKGAWVV